MARQFLIFSLSLFSTFLVSCSKDKNNPGTGFSDMPAAKSQFDNNNYGIYKGIIAGSTGTILFDINNSNSVFASVKLNDPVEGDLVTTFTTTQTVEQNKETTIEFKSVSGSFTFSVAANGTNPTITNINIAGHPNAVIVAIKETSTAIVKCFEGTFTGTDNGIFNAVIQNNNVAGIIKGSSGSAKLAPGTVTGNSVTATGAGSNAHVFTGTISGNNISGNWTIPGTSNAGTWTSKRTF